MGLVRGDLRVGDGLNPFEEICSLSHGSSYLCPDVSPNIPIFWGVWESVEVFHGDSHVSAWCLEHLLVPHHVEGVVKVIRDHLPLFFICSSLSTIGVALLALLPLLIGFFIDDWFNVANIQNQISSSRWKNREPGQTRGVRQEI